MSRYLFIDLSKGTRFILTKKSRDGLRILKDMEFEEEPDPETLKKISSDLQAERCYLNLPLETLGFRIIELPFNEDKKIREVLPYELKERFLESGLEPVYDYIRLPTVTSVGGEVTIPPSQKGSRNGSRLLVLYVEKELLTEIVRRYSKYGLEPDVITCFSLRVALKGFTPPNGEVIVANGDTIVERLLNPPSYKENLLEILQEEILSPVINLKRGDFGIAIEKENLIKRIRITNLLLIVLLGVLTSGYALTIKSDLNNISRIKDFIRKEYKREFPQGKVMDEILQLRSRIKELKEQRDLFTGIPVIEILKGLKPEDGVTITAVEMDTGFITVKGEASDLSKIESLKNRMVTRFHNPQITESTQFGGRIRFSIKAER